MTSILHFADIHFGVEDQAALSSLDAVIEALQPDVSVISGDITQTGAEGGAEDAEERPSASALSAPSAFLSVNPGPAQQNTKQHT